MSLIKALTPLLASKKDVNELIAPPYDIVNHAQVQAHLAKHPNSIMSVTRADGLFNLTESIENTYLAALEQLRKKKDRYYQPSSKPLFLIYKIVGKEILQTGLMALVDSNKLITHELTRQSKVEDRMRLSKTLNCQISPVMLCTGMSSNLADLLENIIKEAVPLYQTLYKKDHHSIFLVDSEDEMLEIEQFFACDKLIYITDGHHRSQTQLTLHKEAPNKYSSHVLSVIFPPEELQILGYHRVVKMPDNKKIMDFWLYLKAHFDILPSSIPILPSSENEFGCFIEQQWYQLIFKSCTATLKGINLLHSTLIETFFNVLKPKEDPNIDFIGGKKAAVEIEQYCKNNPAWIGFTIAPTTIEEIIKTGDENKIMPPKSTYFEPKLLDGFLLQEE